MLCNNIVLSYEMVSPPLVLMFYLYLLSLQYLQHLSQMKHIFFTALGPVPSPFDCYLVNRGLKTLHLRMKEHMKNGLAVARYLEKHPFVDKVVHPGKIYNTLRNTHLLIKLYMYPGKHI